MPPKPIPALVKMPVLEGEKKEEFISAEVSRETKNEEVPISLNTFNGYRRMKLERFAIENYFLYIKTTV